MSKKHQPSVHEKAKTCVAFYEKRKGQPQFEPDWVHPLFAAAYVVVVGHGTSDDHHLVKEAYAAIKTPNGQYDFPPFGRRTLEEGFKVGTTSWAFLGRRLITPIEHRGWVICWRSHGNFAAYMAYHRKRPMGMSALTGDEIGPCTSLEETKRVIGAVEG